MQTFVLFLMTSIIVVYYDLVNSTLTVIQQNTCYQRCSHYEYESTKHLSPRCKQHEKLWHVLFVFKILSDVKKFTTDDTMSVCVMSPWYDLLDWLGIGKQLYVYVCVCVTCKRFLGNY